MSELFEKSIRTLELPRVLQLLSEQAVSVEGKEKSLRLRPETETEDVLRLLDQTDAARQMIGLHGAPSFSGVKPVAEALSRADRGGSLNTRELLTIADCDPGDGSASFNALQSAGKLSGAGHNAISSLRYTPAEQITWRMIFRQKTRPDINIPILP